MCVVVSIACGLTADAFRASFLKQCEEEGETDLMDSVVENAYDSHKRVRCAKHSLSDMFGLSVLTL